MPASTMERDYYLEHFRGRGILIAVDDLGARPMGEAAIARTVDQLVQAGARIVVVRGHSPLLGGGDVITLPSDADVAQPGQPHPPTEDDVEEVLTRIASTCMTGLATDGSVEVDAGVAGHEPPDLVLQLARRLRPYKVVLVSRLGRRPEGSPSVRIVGPDTAESLVTGPSRTVWPPTTAVDAAWSLLDSGVQSVNVCQPEEVEEELLTYQGAGLLLTREPYIDVVPVGMDDVAQAQRLVQRGLEDGFLRPRTRQELAELMLEGYVARVDHGPPAGFAALLMRPYSGQGVAEIGALMTISRFAGGGVGRALVSTLVDQALNRDGLDMVFACTTSPEAASFFGALGFTPVGVDALPPNRWEGYDEARKQTLIALAVRR